MAVISLFSKMIPSILVIVSLISVIHKVDSEDVQTCPLLFQRYSIDHSYCQPPNASCEILAFYPDPKDQEKIVDLHNSYRSYIATGQEGLPQASDMMQLEWDKELAAVAQKYADQCIYEHDCANCRRVVNFGVGQNIAIQTQTGGHTVPQPDWGFAVSNWFSEIIYFNKGIICPFSAPTGEQEYRHFSQVIWANSFRIGCGYVLYKIGNIFTDETYTRLYICNYGPAGNVYSQCVYNKGNAGSYCPINSCVGSACDNEADEITYDGLCKRTDDQAPLYALNQPSLFHCNFRENTNCSNYIEGNPNWVMQSTLGGAHLSIVLSGGENSTIVFNNKINPISSTFCVMLKYRKGPNIDGDEAANTALEIFNVPERNYTVPETLKDYDNPTRQQFSVYNMTLSWNMTTELKYFFSVPPGKPDQFFNIEEIIAVDGACA